MFLATTARKKGIFRSYLAKLNYEKFRYCSSMPPPPLAQTRVTKEEPRHAS